MSTSAAREITRVRKQSLKRAEHRAYTQRSGASQQFGVPLEAGPRHPRPHHRTPRSAGGRPALLRSSVMPQGHHVVGHNLQVHLACPCFVGAGIERAAEAGLILLIAVGLRRWAGMLEVMPQSPRRSAGLHAASQPVFPLSGCSHRPAGRFCHRRAGVHGACHSKAKCVWRSLSRACTGI